MSNSKTLSEQRVSPKSYEEAGVNRASGDQLVEWLESTPIESKNIVKGIGGYASLTRIPFDCYKQPILVTCTDGVGTKALLASQAKKVRSLGQDLVAMNVNDLICTGGDPYYFLDYWASGKLDLELTKEFLMGVREACEKSGCLLVGGETAEMPGLYQGHDFDCAGFATGFVEESQIWGAHRVQVGSQMWALPSSGFHSNGYSLLRRVFEKDISQWMETLLIPTALYVKETQALKKALIEIQAAAHVTGSGFENLLRVLPQGTSAKIETYIWPDIFLEVQKRTDMTDMEMLKTLNCGVGFVYFVSPKQAPALKSLLESLGQKPFQLGHVIEEAGLESKFYWKGVSS